MSEVPAWTLWLAPVATLLAAMGGAVIGGLIARWQAGDQADRAREDAAHQLWVDEQRYRRSVVIQTVHHSDDAAAAAAQVLASLTGQRSVDDTWPYVDSVQRSIGLLSRSIDELRVIAPEFTATAVDLFHATRRLHEVLSDAGALLDAGYAVFDAKERFIAEVRATGVATLDAHPPAPQTTETTGPV